MVDLLTVWGVSNAVGFVFRNIMTKLSKEAIEDYVKDFFRDAIKNSFSLAKEEPLKVSFGRALNEFLKLVQLELEDAADINDEFELQEYTKSLSEFIRSPSVLAILGKPFQRELGEVFPDDDLSTDAEVLSQTWKALNLLTLPEEFNWQRLVRRYDKKVLAILRSDNLRGELLDSVNQQKILHSLKQESSINLDFDLRRYQEGLKLAYGNLRLDSLDTSGVNYRLKLWNMFVPQNLRRWGEDSHRNSRTYSILDILNNRYDYKYTVILGNPGAGKSTLVQYKALEWARSPLDALSSLELPLLIELRNYINNGSQNFIEYLHQGTGVVGGNLNQKEVDEWLKNHQSIVMFDGLDEVLNPRDRENVVIDMINFTLKYPQARVLVTSRVIGYAPERLRNANFHHFILQDLDAEQRHNFIRQWHKLAFQDEWEAERKRDRLLKTVDNSYTLQELAGNPLLLTMMAIMNRYSELPRDRSTLYNQASQVLLQRWEASKNLPQDEKLDPIMTYAIDYQDKQEMLRQIAHHMTSEASSISGNLFIDSEDLRNILARCLTEMGFSEVRAIARIMMEQLTDRSFILCFMGGDYYGFVHRTFLEYYSAWYFVFGYEKKRNISLQELKEKVFYPRWKDASWHETLSLIVSMISEKFAAEILEFLIEQKGEEYGFNNLFLAAKCLSEVRNPSLMKETADKLLEQLKKLGSSQCEVSNAVRNQAIAAIRTTWNDDPQTLIWLDSLTSL